VTQTAEVCVSYSRHSVRNLIDYFIYTWFINFSFSSSVCVASNDRIISEQRIEKDVEGTDGGLI
jgi:hypothetical protein